jgi:hypothetical protein
MDPHSPFAVISAALILVPVSFVIGGACGVFWSIWRADDIHDPKGGDE